MGRATRTPKWAWKESSGLGAPHERSPKNGTPSFLGGRGKDSGAQNLFATEEANKRARCITADLSNDVNKLKLQLQKRNHGMCNIYSVKCQLPVASLLLFCDICAHIDPLLTRATGVNVLVATQDRLHRSYSSRILSS